MTTTDRLGQLLSNEQFQNDTIGFDKYSKDKQKEILKKYSITRKEFIYARKLFYGISFKHDEVDAQEVDYALSKLMRRILETSSVPNDSKGRRINYMAIVSRIAAIFAIPLLISTIYLNQKSNRLQSEYSIQASTASVINTIKSPMGAKTQVVLPDGSNVWLNSGSSLSYPSRFDAKSRNVELTGEAFFEVVKNEKTPMLVSAGGIQVKVYGTKFNLNAYVGGKEIKTALVEGKVSLIVNGSTKENFLKPGYAALFNCNKRILEIKKIGDIDEFIGWKDGKLLFRDEKFVNILEKLERWYNVEIHLSDKTLEHYALYATFFDENIEQVLNILASSLPIEVEYPKRVKLSDGTYSKRKIIIKRDTKRKMTIN